MDALGDLLTAPLEDWDALICTSPAVRQGVEHIQQAYGEYLAERLGLQAAPRPRLQLPVIPLGVDCEALEGGAGREAARRQWREKLRIADGDLAVLFLGRLSFHAKAHPMPMYLALEQASHATGARLHVIHAGWFANEWIKGGFEQGWKAMCPSVRAVVVDGRDQAVRDSIWHAADIFCSLSDNIQETFGLTPVEAMAAGLPVVASDWDGYRGTVEHGHTGFLVPTTMPGGGNGLDLVYRYFAGQETYDQYVGRVSQCIAVDVTAAATAFIELIRNPALRRELGERGKQRARRLFDWSVVIGAYEDLWQELAQRRRAAAGAVPAAQRGSPLRGDPFGVFSHYATQLLDSDARLGLAVANPVREFQQRAALRFNAFARDTFLPDARIRDLFRRLRVRDGATVAELASELNVTAAERPVFTRTVAWLMKLGIVRLHPGVDPDTGHRG
jgi:glycosyltransferase involved in cell wall biosynthesis